MIISRRLILSTSLILAIIFIALALISVRDFLTSLQDQETTYLDNLNQSFQSQISSAEELTQALAKQVSNTQEVQNAFAAEDGELLADISLVPFVELSTLHGISEQTFHTPPATVFLSLGGWSMAEEDESLTRLTVVAANTQRRDVSGIELTSSGLAMWSVVPIEASVGTNDVLAGSVSFAREIDARLLRELKSQYRVDWQLLINRQIAERVDYEGLENLISGPYPELSLQATTLGPNPVFAEPEVYRQVLLGKTVTSIVTGRGQSYAMMSVPLRDFSGDVVAVVDILADRSPMVAQARDRLGITLLIIFAGVILAGAALIFISWRLLRPIQDLTEAAAAVAQGDLGHSVQVNPPRIRTPLGEISMAQDEIGMLADSFNSMTSQLSDLVGRLEGMVAERTHDLERRFTQFRVAAEIARDITRTTELDQLLKTSVDQIHQRFDFYYVGIFLVEAGPQGEYAVLRAATGEAGRIMLQRGHKLRVGRVGIVGAVTGSGRPRIALNVDEDAAHFKNPLLPETRAEMALPMRLGEQVIGALDVQSRIPEAFEEEDITILQAIADQLAIAIQNARLIQEQSRTVAELEQAYGRFTQTSWQTFLDSRRAAAGYIYQSGSLQPLRRGTQVDAPEALQEQTGPVLRPEALQALQEGQAVISSGLELDSNGPEASTEETQQVQEVAPESQAGATDQIAVRSGLAMPIKLRDQVIGVLDLRFASEDVTPETVALVEEAASRLGLVLESARLLQEAQRLASREQQINWIANQVRGSINLETILQNTVRELGRTLGATRTYIQIGSEAPGSMEYRQDNETAHEE